MSLEQMKLDAIRSQLRNAKQLKDTGMLYDQLDMLCDVLRKMEERLSELERKAGDSNDYLSD